MKQIIKILMITFLMGASFIGGIFWEYTAQRQEIADIEQVALEACNVRVKTIQKLCK